MLEMSLQLIPYSTLAVQVRQRRGSLTNNHDTLQADESQDVQQDGEGLSGWDMLVPCSFIVQLRPVFECLIRIVVGS